MLGKRGTRICGVKKMKCFFDVLLSFGNPNSTNDAQRSLTPCNCMPACTAISYTAEVTQMDYDWRHIRKAFSDRDWNFEEYPGYSTNEKKNTYKIEVTVKLNQFLNNFQYSELIPTLGILSKEFLHCSPAS